MAIKRRTMAEMLGEKTAEQCKKAETVSPGQVILGVDPGTNVMGYAVVKVCSGGRLAVLEVDVLRLSKIEDRYERLGAIFNHISQIVVKYKPSEAAFEAPFYGQNVQSMLKLGRAQGVAMAAALTQGVRVYEYAPTRVKQAITGRGAASKEQVADLLSRILDAGELTNKELDATDALSVAVCHYFAMDNRI